MWKKLRSETYFPFGKLSMGDSLLYLNKSFQLSMNGRNRLKDWHHVFVSKRWRTLIYIRCAQICGFEPCVHWKIICYFIRSCQINLFLSEIKWIRYNECGKGRVLLQQLCMNVVEGMCAVADMSWDKPS